MGIIYQWPLFVGHMKFSARPVTYLAVNIRTVHDLLILAIAMSAGYICISAGR